MIWSSSNGLRNLNNSLGYDKLNYADNEYDSSGFNPINLKTQDNIRNKKLYDNDENDSLKQNSKSNISNVWTLNFFS